MDKPYLFDDRVRLLHEAVKDSQGLGAAQGLTTLRTILAKPNGVVRLVGLSGVGKTRLIQALFDERIGNDALLKSDALYTDISDGQDPVPLEMVSRLITLGQRVVMIVDNCPVDLHRKLAVKRQAQTLAGFMMSAGAIAPEETEEFFDAAIADHELHPYLIYWLIWAGRNPRDFARLTKALEFDTVPVWTFSHLAGGRAHETLTDEQLDKFIQVLTARPDGSVVAVEILGMRIFGLRSDKQPVSDQIKATARDFLRQVQFEHKSSRLGHMLGEIVAVSFGKPEHEAEVREFCNRILEAIKAYKIYVMDIGDVIRELTRAHPISVFDILVEQAAEDEDIGHTLFEDMRSNQASPLDSVPPDVWLGWAAAKPETRFIYLAHVIRFSQGNDDDASTGWSPAAEQLINTAPDPATVLNAFMSRFEPTSGWAGSFANTMASRVPMIEALTQHPRAEVAAWATEYIAKFSDRVARTRESEAARNRSEHEAFE